MFSLVRSKLSLQRVISMPYLSFKRGNLLKNTIVSKPPHEEKKFVSPREFVQPIQNTEESKNNFLRFWDSLTTNERYGYVLTLKACENKDDEELVLYEAYAWLEQGEEHINEAIYAFERLNRLHQSKQLPPKYRQKVQDILACYKESKLHLVCKFWPDPHRDRSWPKPEDIYEKKQ